MEKWLSLADVGVGRCVDGGLRDTACREFNLRSITIPVGIDPLKLQPKPVFSTRIVISIEDPGAEFAGGILQVSNQDILVSIVIVVKGNTTAGKTIVGDTVEADPLPSSISRNLQRSG